MTMSSIFRNILRLRKIPKFIEGLLFKRVILVFQMGKVGSVSVVQAIRRSLVKQNGEAGYEITPNEIGNTILLHSHRIYTSGVFYRLIILWRVRLGLPVKVVCPIREPLARDVSEFFFSYVHKYPNLLANADLGELKVLLTDSKPNGVYPPPARRAGVHWFDKQFRPQMRIDVYKQPFPKDRKWQIYRRGFTQVLVYRIDLKRSERVKLISRFLGIQLAEIRLENAAKDKNYAELYSRFRESVKLPEHYIGRMHNSRFAQHFWSPQELKAAADKWRGTPSN